jgi:hypothetical protein
VARDFSQPLEDGYIHDLNRNGPVMQNMDRYLAERGFAVCRLFLRDLFHPRTVWPPEPFADTHLCHVKVWQGARNTHWVVMLGDGSVLDPGMAQPKRLTDYYEVYNVAAVVRVAMAFPTPFCE